MLTSIQLENWRGHMNTTVPLAPFTVLVGSNAVGKTAVLEAVDLLGQFLSTGAINVSKSRESVVRHGERRCTIRSKFREIPLDGVDFEFHQHGTLHHDDRVWAVTKGRREQFPANDRRTWQVKVAAAAAVCTPFFASPSAKQISAASKVSRTSVESNGFGTASALASFKINDDERFHRIVSSIRRIIPQIEALVLKPALADEFGQRSPTESGYVRTYKRVEGYALWVRFTDGAVLPAEAVSEGTLLAIATLAAIESRDATVLVIDDIDRALHMRAQAEFVTALRKLQEARPTLQIIATTHSPLIVQHFDDSEVVVMARHPDGRVAAKKLSEHPERKRYASLSAAELWVAEQEDWVLAP